MKLTGTLIALSIALLSGCATQAPVQVPQTAQAEEIDSDFVLPADYGAPGTMQMSWEPTPEPPKKDIRARKLDAKPQFVSTKKRSLFVLPTQREN